MKQLTSYFNFRKILYFNVCLFRHNRAKRFSRHRDKEDYLLEVRRKTVLYSPVLYSPVGTFRIYLQCIVLQLPGGKIGQGDSGQPAASDPLRQAASAAGRRYTELPIPLPNSGNYTPHLCIQITLDHPEHLKHHRHRYHHTAPHNHSSLLTPRRKSTSCKSTFSQKYDVRKVCKKNGNKRGKIGHMIKIVTEQGAIRANNSTLPFSHSNSALYSQIKKYFSIFLICKTILS